MPLETSWYIVRNLSDSRKNDVLFGISGLSFGEETGAEAATISKNLVQPRLKRRLRVSRKQHCPPLCRRRPSAFSGRKPNVSSTNHRVFLNLP